MSENIIIALITAGGAILGGIVGAIINAYATIKAAGLKVEQTPSQAIQEARKQKSYWGWGILGGTIIGAVIALAILAAMGIIPTDTPGDNIIKVDTSTPTNISIATATRPAPTSTATVNAGSAPSPAISLYDNFDSPEINVDLWLTKLASQCDVKQENGQITFKNISAQEGFDCRLYLTHPQLVSANDLQLLEAQIMIDEDYEGEYLIQGIAFDTTTSEGVYWTSFCGLAAMSGSLKFGTHIWSEEGDEIQKWFTAEPNEWYTVRLELDPKTLETRCLVDDQLVGSVISKYSSEFKDLTFERYVNMHRGKDAVATSYVDNVRVLP